MFAVVGQYCCSANKTEEAIQCPTKALGTIVLVLKQFDEENNVPDIIKVLTRISLNCN